MKIEKSRYEGYIWYSDRQQPNLIEPNNDFGLEIAENGNPFVIEGQLFDRANKLSISIKYVDGKYITKQLLLTNFVSMRYENKEYYANRMNGRKLYFRQYWQAEPDALCEGMEVLQPAELIFVGFKKYEED